MKIYIVVKTVWGAPRNSLATTDKDEAEEKYWILKNGTDRPYVIIEVWENGKMTEYCPRNHVTMIPMHDPHIG